MDKNQLKHMLSEMLESGEIEIDVDLTQEYFSESIYLETKIKIDGKAIIERVNYVTPILKK